MKVISFLLYSMLLFGYICDRLKDYRLYQHFSKVPFQCKNLSFDLLLVIFILQNYEVTFQSFRSLYGPVRVQML